MARGKNRNRERENRRKTSRKYGQVKLKHAKKGMLSCVIAASVLVILFLLLLVAYKREGNTGSFIGSLGLVSLIAAVTGCVFGYKGFKEREKNYLTCKIGVGCNLFVVIIYVAIFFRGLF